MAPSHFVHRVIMGHGPKIDLHSMTRFKKLRLGLGLGFELRVR